MNSLINQKKVAELCLQYSAANHADAIATRKTSLIREELDAVCKVAQTSFRRRLARTLVGMNVSIMRCRVWNLIEHGKNPVTVIPVATAEILIRKGVRVELDFIASDLNIEIELKKLAAAVHAFN